MSATANRFAMLNLDDSDEETMKEGGMVEQEAPLPIMTSGRDHLRTWNLQDGRPAEVRDWNVDTGAQRHRRGGLFSRYAFKDDARPKDRSQRQYAFRDDSPPRESLKPVTPIASITPPPYSGAITPPPPPPGEEFPKLSDYSRPQTPPYPPDDSWYPTLAERVKKAMEQQEVQEKSVEKRVINMDCVIPISTVLAKSIVLQ